MANSHFFLFINTCSKHGELCLFNDTQVLQYESWQKQNSHSEVVTECLAGILEKERLKPSELSGIFCTIGPGSFTGARVGVSLAKSLAFVNNLWICPISSLELLACRTNFHGKITCGLDAQKNSIFLQEFEVESQQFSSDSPPEIVSIVNLQERSKDLSKNVVGDGFEKYRDNFHPDFLSSLYFFNPVSSNFQNILPYKNHFLASNGKKHWHDIQPLYLKLSAPEELLKNKNLD